MPDLKEEQVNEKITDILDRYEIYCVKDNKEVAHGDFITFVESFDYCVFEAATKALLLSRLGFCANRQDFAGFASEIERYVANSPFPLPDIPSRFPSVLIDQAVRDYLTCAIYLREHKGVDEDGNDVDLYTALLS